MSSTPPVRLAYADPPYPGCAHYYPEKAEVDHIELFDRLERYDGWALSTNENALQTLLQLAPPGVRILAWCKSDAAPFFGHPFPSWEPVICQPARPEQAPQKVAAHFVSPKLSGFITGKRPFPGVKPPGFCEWIIRCLGAEPEDTLVDLFPGTGIMGEVWERFQRQPALWTARVDSSLARREKIRRSVGVQEELA